MTRIGAYAVLGIGLALIVTATVIPCHAEERPLVAWSFDDRPTPPTTVSVSSGDRVIPITSSAAVGRAAGVHGWGLHLEGRHQLQVDVGPALGDISTLTLAAWVKPERFDRHNEIFRQECPRRMLFSFQENGSILSLGLNIDGYVECDAPVDPQLLLDGTWHHSAATYDGLLMRVYLDGHLIAERSRPGAIQTQPDAPAFVGSSRGQGEFFQGNIDELAIYANPLSGKRIAQMYKAGIAELVLRTAEAKEQLHAIFNLEPTFAETLANARANARSEGVAPRNDLAGMFNSLLRSSFPEDFADFTRFAGNTPSNYLAAPGADFMRPAFGRLVELLTEYRPITESQWKSQTPDELAEWEEIDRLVSRYESLFNRGSGDATGRERIELLLDLGRRVRFRPEVSEAVAPYVTPETPPAPELTPAEGRAAIEADWLHQADGRPTAERVAGEIGWARELAERIAALRGDRPELSPQLARLSELEKQLAAAATDEQVQTLYLAVRAVKRRIMLENPVVDFSQVLLVDMPLPQGKEWRHETRHRLGYMAVPGGRLTVLDGLAPDAAARQLAPTAPLHGSFWRADLSFDARRVLFCFKPHNDKAFHLYEINVDGTGLKQLTDGPYDDLDPIYLPDGRHILFSTTRGHTYVRCMPPTNAYVLARCERSGENIYLVSRNNEPDYLPSVMDDGRVVYTRWEYTDKPLWRAQGLWAMNPDGTQVNTLWGNQSVWPDLMKDARCIPGSTRIMFTGSAHHNWFAGSVGIVDPAAGFNFPIGLTKVTADVDWPESGNGPVDPVESHRYHTSGQYTAYYSPYPLSESDFLVSAERNGKFVLYLMDTDGNRELIYQGHDNVLHAMPIRPRRKPPAIVDRVAWPKPESREKPADGVLFSSNVYAGVPSAMRGKARYLRVLNIQPKTYTYWHKRPYLSTGPVVSAVQSEGVKRVLGTIPIEADGSVAFHAPAGMALHFQLLDEKYRALQTMRSFTGVMPGEERGCTGCHEKHSRTPEISSSHTTALSDRPHSITPPPWSDDTVSYARYVRPMLDEYCAGCHEGDGEARDVLDLTYRPGRLDFDECYWLLTGNPSWGRPYEAPAVLPPGWGIAGMLMVEGYDKLDPAGYRTPEPMTALSYRSRLVELASSGEHYDVKVDPISLRRLIVWIDAMCPYRGEEEVREIPDPEFQGVDWLSIRPLIRSAPKIVRPGPVD